MLVIINKILPIGKKYYAINLFGVIFAKGECNKVVLNHEKIHSTQMRELLFLPFYVFYVIEWLFKVIKYINGYQAYRNISFEKEAYSNQENLNYLRQRKPYSFLRY